MCGNCLKKSKIKKKKFRKCLAHLDRNSRCDFINGNFILERMLKKKFFFLHFNFFFCRNYTSRPRMSGTSGGYELVQILYNSWKSFGIDEVKVAPYDVLMSYPNRTNPNRVRSCIIFYMTPPPKKKEMLRLIEL